MKPLDFLKVIGAVKLLENSSISYRQCAHKVILIESMKKYNPPYLDAEEKEIMEGLEVMDARAAAKPSGKERKEIQDAARRFLKSETKMNIRIDAGELEKLKDRAAREGLRYQTLVKSILHKYLTGRLVERE